MLQNLLKVSEPSNNDEEEEKFEIQGSGQSLYSELTFRKALIKISSGESKKNNTEVWPSVLIVDDDAMNIEVISTMLESLNV